MTIGTNATMVKYVAFCDPIYRETALSVRFDFPYAVPIVALSDMTTNSFR